MQNHNKRRAGVAAALAVTAVAASVFGTATIANADPAGSPTYRPLAGVGSDTTQDLNNGLGSVLTSSGSLVLGSYDATGSATIKTKATGATFTRPNGSSQGVAALKAAKTSGTYNGVALAPTDLQFARSSSGATFVSGGAYSYVPLALDAVTFAKNASGAAPSNIPLGSFTGQDSDADGILDLTLRNIYTRNATTTLETSTGTTYTVGNQASGAQIVPFKPQSGSGTLAFWTAQLGGSLGSIVADSYTDGSGSHTVQEHDGAVTAAVPSAIVPFSIAQHIAQGNSATLASNYGITVTDRRNGAVLGSVNGVSPLVLGRLNTAFPIARAVYTVVQYSELSTNTALAAAFQGSSASAYNARRPGSPSNLVITDFGFGDIRSGVTLNGVTYTAGDTTSFRAN